MIAFNFDAKQMSRLHNVKCELHFLQQHLSGVLNDKMLDRVKKVLDEMNDIMKPVYFAEQAQQIKDDAIIESIRKKYSLKHSVWSVGDVDFEKIVFEDVSKMAHRETGMTVDLPSKSSNADLWLAAEKLIKAAGATDHIFIEDFYRDSTDPSMIWLSTGS